MKKLRYVADFLLPLCTDGKAAKPFTTRLSELQDELGAFNDMATTGALLADLVTDSSETAWRQRPSPAGRRTPWPAPRSASGMLGGIFRNAAALGSAGHGLNGKSVSFQRSIFELF